MAFSNFCCNIVFITETLLLCTYNLATLIFISYSCNTSTEIILATLPLKILLSTSHKAQCIFNSNDKSFIWHKKEQRSNDIFSFFVICSLANWNPLYNNILLVLAKKFHLSRIGWHNWINFVCVDTGVRCQFPIGVKFTFPRILS